MPRPRSVSAVRAWSGSRPQPSTDKAKHAAQALIHDARRGPDMVTAVEQHVGSLGRQQLVVVVQHLFAELAARRTDAQ